MREEIQGLLTEICDIQISTEIPDELIEQNKTYFSYSLQEDYQNSDYDNNYTYRVSLIGYLKRKKDNTENTLEILDTKTKEILNKLKEMNFKCSYKDETSLDYIKKIKITGFCFSLICIANSTGIYPKNVFKSKKLKKVPRL